MRNSNCILKIRLAKIEDQQQIKARASYAVDLKLT